MTVDRYINVLSVTVTESHTLLLHIKKAKCMCLIAFVFQALKEKKTILTQHNEGSESLTNQSRILTNLFVKLWIYSDSSSYKNVSNFLCFKDIFIYHSKNSEPVFL